MSEQKEDKIIIEINGIKHLLVEGSSYECEKCSLKELCDNAYDEFGLCETFTGVSYNNEVKAHQFVQLNTIKN